MSSPGTIMDKAGDAATSAIGSAAGGVADPKTGLQHAKSSLNSPVVRALGVGLLVGFLMGRFTRRR